MEVAKIFSQPPLIAYKRDTNRDMLVWYKLWPPITHTPGTTLCNQDKCKTFPFICTSLEFQGPNCSMNVNKHFNCHTYNIIYVIRCTISTTKCTKLYIGKTGRTLNTHFKEHLADIKYHSRRDKSVASHFNQAGHSIHNVRVKGLWLLFTDNARDRKDMESYLIGNQGQ